MKINKITFFEYLKLNGLYGIIGMTILWAFFMFAPMRGIVQQLDYLKDLPGTWTYEQTWGLIIWAAVVLVYFIGSYLSWKKL